LGGILKTILIALIALLVTNAKAAEIYKSCSNSDGTVSWMANPYSNIMRITFLTVGGPMTTTVPLSEVKIKFLNTVTIEDKVEETCWIFRKSHVYAAQVKIKYGKSDFPANVICTDREDTPLRCQE
jgi:hypothetical protein